MKRESLSCSVVPRAGMEHEQRARQLLVLYGDPKASVAELLCDRHSADVPAYTVVEPDRDINRVAVEEAANACDRPRAVASTIDVADGEQVNQWATDTLASFRRIDVLVNNAGVVRDRRLEHMSDEDWQTVLDVSLRGTFICCRAVFGHMKARSYGRILSVSSIAWRGHFGSGNCAAAKAGIVGLARTIAMEGRSMP